MVRASFGGRTLTLTSLSQEGRGGHEAALSGAATESPQCPLPRGERGPAGGKNVGEVRVMLANVAMIVAMVLAAAGAVAVAVVAAAVLALAVVAAAVLWPLLLAVQAGPARVAVRARPPARDRSA